MVNKKDFTVYMFASFGKFSEIPAGGGQTSSRRLLNTIKSLGYQVRPFGRHIPRFHYAILRKSEVYFHAILDTIRFALYLLLKKRKNSIVLFIGYNGAMLPLEVALGLVSRILGFKVVYFLKGGGSKQLYENGSSIYRWLFRQLTGLCEAVFAEGMENTELIQRFSKTRTFYLPNYVENGFEPSSLPVRTKDSTNIIYFGRIDQQKNVLQIVDIFETLCNRFEHLHLTIIGNGDSGYDNEVTQRVQQSPYGHLITKIGKISHDELRQKLVSQHIFLFPSIEPREGHSNSLNEAMAWGLVPVTSSNNFIPQIVDDDTLIAKDGKSESYVDILSGLIADRNLLDEKSRKMYSRVQEHFTQTVVESQLDKELESLMK